MKSQREGCFQMPEGAQGRQREEVPGTKWGQVGLSGFLARLKARVSAYSPAPAHANQGLHVEG